ncbi:MAG: hypothetical protein A2161_11865 [Candidatus Schekmanbacteria bacterium RBG_13_48_7]|uniref:AraC effector-binding domain-containing protein n=1 Tax=Candidatus Schekmanbacteria bacterium RBG_13_48_7 TaxID=1817878 RepID=A0A1F7S2G2_9BACT|nr:MAG: hypothetical protein A2161_11865 [Candidatus Schekmanbacteria bacterium RBG_13_48_7]
MLKIIIIAALVIAIILLALSYFMMKGPDLSQFDYLKNPRITSMKNQKVIVVKSKGDPNEIGGKAFGLLFKTYFKIKGTPKGPNQSAPRARWPVDFNTPKREWMGLYAMPVPDNVISLPEINAEPGLTVALTTWEYGEVAEILHVGPYSREQPTVEKLNKFINDQGYKIIGEHEEEYLKGPGMFFQGNPEKYYTIIRYRISKPVIEIENRDDNTGSPEEDVP